MKRLHPERHGKVEHRHSSQPVPSQHLFAQSKAPSTFKELFKFKFKFMK